MERIMKTLMNGYSSLTRPMKQTDGLMELMVCERSKLPLDIYETLHKIGFKQIEPILIGGILTEIMEVLTLDLLLISPLMIAEIDGPESSKTSNKEKQKL